MSKSTEETRGLVQEDILQKVFRAGIGFERGESMMENSHFKMTPQHALKEIEAELAKRVEEARADEALKAAVLYEEVLAYGGDFLHEQQGRIGQLRERKTR